jgi:hypothetical protein
LAEFRERLAASKAAAVAAKDEFVSRYVRGRENVSVGIGLNRARDDWAMKVFVQSAADRAGLPDHFRDYEVEVQVTGRARAHSA